MADQFREPLQTAVGFIAARRRGDNEGAEHLLGAFDNESQRTLAFCFLAELAFQMLAEQTGQPTTELLRELSAQIAQKPA